MRRRSRGIYAFATPPAHFHNMSAEYRLLMEEGRQDVIAAGINADMTMVSATCSYDAESYMRWSPKVYGHRTKSVWSPDYWMVREASFLYNTDFVEAERVYREVPKNQYIPVSWTHEDFTHFDVKSFARHLMERAGKKQVPVCTFAIAHVSIKGYPYKRYVLYARKDFLATFRTGQDLLNYRRMAVNFKKVYGFD